MVVDDVQQADMVQEVLRNNGGVQSREVTIGWSDHNKYK